MRDSVLSLAVYGLPDENRQGTLLLADNGKKAAYIEKSDTACGYSDYEGEGE